MFEYHRKTDQLDADFGGLLQICRRMSVKLYAGEGNGTNSRYIMCDVELSKIISFENVKRLLIERTAGTLLRPIVIDGLLIGASYDQKYALDDHIGCLENYVRQMKPSGKIRRGFRVMEPYPVQALVKVLFYFIARGHKATAFLPIFFDEQLDKSCCSSCALVSNVEQFRELVLLKLIKFLPNENFASQIKHRTADCHGILVTSPEGFHFNSSNLHRNDHSEESITSADVTNTSYDLPYSDDTEVLLDNSKFPIIIPLFRPYNHRLIISLDVIRWRKVLQVEKQEVSIPQYKLLVDEQLTLQTQFGLLNKLVSMLDDQFSCGPSDADIVSLFRHALGLADQDISSVRPM
uniref:RNase_Zc3h12a_2 domain-containing protein n=1 Tax=Elaeophora elaphi TaxID=1147741 RepID=A0A0R3RVZ8_9BILA